MPWWYPTGKRQIDETDEDRAALPNYAQDSFDERGNGLFGYHLARAEGARHAAGQEIDKDEPDASWAETNVNAMQQAIDNARRIVKGDIENRDSQ